MVKKLDFRKKLMKLFKLWVTYQDWRKSTKKIYQKVSWIICNKIDLIQDEELDIIQKEIETALNFSSKDIFLFRQQPVRALKSSWSLLKQKFLDNKSDLVSSLTAFS